MAEQIGRWVMDQFATVLEIDAESITPASLFADDLDADSIDLIEVVNRAESTYGVKIEEDLLYDIETVGDLIAVITKATEAKG